MPFGEVFLFALFKSSFIQFMFFSCTVNFLNVQCHGHGRRSPKFFFSIDICNSFLFFELSEDLKRLRRDRLTACTGDGIFKNQTDSLVIYLFVFMKLIFSKVFL
jgi:hypothetical protein